MTTFNVEYVEPFVQDGEYRISIKRNGTALLTIDYSDPTIPILKTPPGMRDTVWAEWAKRLCFSVFEDGPGKFFIVKACAPDIFEYMCRDVNDQQIRLYARLTSHIYQHSRHIAVIRVYDS